MVGFGGFDGASLALPRFAIHPLSGQYRVQQFKKSALAMNRRKSGWRREHARRCRSNTLNGAYIERLCNDY